MFADNGFQEDKARGGLFLKPKISPKDVILRDDAGQVLYSVVGAYGRLPKVRWTEIKYFSAASQEDAIARFLAFYWTIPRASFLDVVAGPAIGFFVHDNHGDSLSAGGTRPEASPLDRNTEYEAA